MNFLNNVKIRTKLFLSFVIVVGIMVLMNINNIRIISQVDNDYSDSIESTQKKILNRFEAYTLFNEIRRTVLVLSVVSDDRSQMEEAVSVITSKYNTLNSILDKIESDNSINVSQVKNDLNQYYTLAMEFYNEILQGNLLEAFNSADEKTTILANNINSALYTSNESTLANLALMSENATEMTTHMIIEIVITIIVALIFSIIAVFVVSKNISKPLNNLSYAAREISKGNLNVNLKNNNRDEVHQLANDLAVVVDTIGLLANDLTFVSKEIEEKGEIEARINEDKFSGVYREVAIGINQVMGGIIQDSLAFITFVKGCALGDFSLKIRKLVGKKAVMNETADLLINNLSRLSNEINTVVKFASEGKLDRRIDVSKYQNDWEKLANGLNSLLEGVSVPIEETISVLESFAEGNLSVSVNGNYKGSYLSMKNAINNTITTLGKYINEISHVLNEMAEQNFKLEIANEYAGDFKPIKIALNKIIDNLNMILRDINNSSEQVATGARQVAESSQSMATGSTEQAGAVQELRATMELISHQTEKNAEDAQNANELTLKANNDVTSCNEEMKNMLTAMEEISIASANIFKIIKVIDDIAFQTNLLALNAAVEAARAGEHGKGFAVVAGEVRSLAGRSKDSAKETTALIEGAIQKSKEGTRLAIQTAQTLDSVVGEITDISGLISGIAEASTQQKSAIDQVNTGIVQISEVTQNTASVSEESASASEELFSQAEIFKQTVSKFQLRDIR